MSHETDTEFIERVRAENTNQLGERSKWDVDLFFALDRLEAAVEKGEKLCVQNGNLLMENQALVKANEDRDLTSEVVELVVACRDIDKIMLFTPNRHLAQVQLRFKKALAAFAVSDEAEKDAKEGC